MLRENIVFFGNISQIGAPLPPKRYFLEKKMWILAIFRNKIVNFMAKNNGHQNFTKSLGLSTPPPYLGNIPKKEQFFYLFPYMLLGKNFIMWKKLSVTDGLPAKRIEKLNNNISEKKNCEAQTA